MCCYVNKQPANEIICHWSLTYYVIVSNPISIRIHAALELIAQKLLTHIKELQCNSLLTSNNMAQAEVDSDGSWADDVPEDEERGRQLDIELARRANVLATRQETNEWCTCGNCTPVENAHSAFDVTCCQESAEATALCQEYEVFDDIRAYPCVTNHPSFYHLCLYERIVDNVAHVYRMEGVDERHIDRNDKLRYTAYRAYSNWAHGYLGRRNRRVIPHCVMKAIRRRFQAQPRVPGEPVHYRGYRQPPRNDVEQQANP